jgi:signal transduction histidine kinase
MHLIGVLSYTENSIGELPEIEQELNQLGYAVHLEPMRANMQSPTIGDFYYEEGAIILWLCRCFGDPERCEKAVNVFMENAVDAILAITNVAVDIANGMVGRTGIPIIFMHVTRDPETIAEMERLHINEKITGVWDSSLEIAEERLGLITELVPTPTTVHAIYNPNIPAVVAEMDLLRKSAAHLNVQLVPHEACDPKQVKEKIAGLPAQQDQAILRLADPTTDSAAGLMGAIAHEQNIPYVGLSLDELERCGALFALEVRGAGKLIASMIDRVLRGESPSLIPFALASQKTLAVNLQAAQDLGVVVSPAVLSKSAIILPAQHTARIGTRLISTLILALFAIILTLTLAQRFNSPYLYALTTGTAVIVILWVLIYLNQNIVRPIRSLAATAEKIGSGELNTPIVDFKASNEVDILTRALRRMRSNLKASYANLDQKNQNLKEQLLELTQAYRSLQRTQRELELASRRIIEAEDSQRFAMTTYIHDEIIRSLDDISAIAHQLKHPDLVQLSDDLEGRMRQVRYDLSVPILKDIGFELRRLAQETLPAIYPGASRLSMQLDLAALDQNLKLEPSSIFLIYRFVRGAISNVYRHSGATTLQVSATVCDGQLSLYVADNGNGFEPSRIESFIKAGHYFFHDIQIRTKQLNGFFTVQALPPGGMKLQLSLPLAQGMKTRRRASIPQTNHKLQEQRRDSETSWR